MKYEEFDLQQYLARIGLSIELGAGIAAIKTVMNAHVREIPFENIDVQLGKEISYEPECVFQKLVCESRGGYCYEHNALFAMFLSHMGFSYKVLGCRPMFYPDLRPRTHLALLVEVENSQWLCDLGFGALGISDPMDISVLDTAVKQGQDYFRLVKGDKDYLILQSSEAELDVNSAWASQYAFNLSDFEWIDFAPANYFNNTHPESFFVKNLVVLIKTAQGRYALLGRRLKSVEAHNTTERELDDQAMAETLQVIFKVPELVVKQIMSHINANT